MPPDFDTTTAHSARVYDFYLGGTDHFAVDRGNRSESHAGLARGAHGGRRPAGTTSPLPAEVNWYGGVGRKP